METTERLDLSAIKNRVEAATPGPWKWIADDDDCHGLYTGDVPVIGAYGNHTPGWVDIGAFDAEFISHAREDIPALIAEVERLQAEQVERFITDDVLEAMTRNLDRAMYYLRGELAKRRP